MPAFAIALLLTATAPEAATAAPVQEITEPNPREMNRDQIREHNASLEATDPNFIRCERVTEMGSLIARRRDCRTNAQWSAAEDAGNEEARRVIDHTRSKAWNTSG